MGVRPGTRTRLVVVGHGPAGHRLVDALRERDTGGSWQVTILGEEPRPAYDRVALTSYLTEDADLASPAHDPGVTIRNGDPVVSIDRAGRTVTTRSGHVVPYDTLVLATGSVPFVPPVDGRDLPGVFVYRTIDDLDALRAYCAARAARADAPPARRGRRRDAAPPYRGPGAAGPRRDADGRPGRPRRRGRTGTAGRRHAARRRRGRLLGGHPAAGPAGRGMRPGGG